jgi:hypothetical protein
MRPGLIVCAAAFFVLVGCGGAAPTHSPAKQAALQDQVAHRPGQAAEAPAAGQDGRADQNELAPAKGVAAQAAPARVTRKIVYNADVALVVGNLDKGEADLKALVEEMSGFVAGSEITGSVGSPRSGHWRVRVPVERFDAFLTAVVKVGVPERNKADSQDVTDEYYDLEDRIKNKKLEQETLRGYLLEKKATSKLEEILTIEKELSRVRGELDQMEGRLRRLKDVSALATVNVTMREEKDYVPPQAPTFGGSVRATFADSIDLLVRFGQGVVIVAVALAPWLVVLAVVAVPGWRLGRPLNEKSPAVFFVPQLIPRPLDRAEHGVVGPVGRPREVLQIDDPLAHVGGPNRHRVERVVALEEQFGHRVRILPGHDGIPGSESGR